MNCGGTKRMMRSLRVHPSGKQGGTAYDPATIRSATLDRRNVREFEYRSGCGFVPATPNRALAQGGSAERGLCRTARTA